MSVTPLIDYKLTLPGLEGASALVSAQNALRTLTGILGLRLQEKKGSGDADGFIHLLVEVRKQKLWAFSDRIRVRLKELGVTIEGGKEGTTWRWG